MQEEFKMLSIKQMFLTVCTCDEDILYKLIDDITRTDDGKVNMYNLITVGTQTFTDKLFNLLNGMPNIPINENYKNNILSVIFQRLFKAEGLPINSFMAETLLFKMSTEAFERSTPEEIQHFNPEMEVDTIQTLKDSGLFRAIECKYSTNTRLFNFYKNVYQEITPEKEQHQGFMDFLNITGTPKEQCRQVLMLSDETLFNAIYEHFDVFILVFGAVSLSDIRLDICADILSVCPLIKIYRRGRLKLTKDVLEKRAGGKLIISSKLVIDIGVDQGLIDKAEAVHDGKLYHPNLGFTIVDQAIESNDFTAIRTSKFLDKINQ